MWILLHFALLVPTAFAGANNSVSTWAGMLEYEEDWGYADIRSGAHTFWWLYAVKPDSNRPLFLWLQGGPGSDSTDYGNFEETGPKLINGSDNPATWLQVADMVYVDNPVRAGFSYTDDSAAFARNNSQIGKDLLAWFQHFLNIHPEYSTRPFYIFCESYGGKYAVEFANVIMKQNAAGRLVVDFRGVRLGDAFISPIDYLTTFGEYLYASGYFNDNQLTKSNTQAAKCRRLVESNAWCDATDCFFDTIDLIKAETHGVSTYNILKKEKSDDWSKKRRKREVIFENKILRMFNAQERSAKTNELSNYMNTTVREKLGIIPPNVQFENQSFGAFLSLVVDFMKPVINTVDNLLESGVNVIVYNGNEDLICNVIGTKKWMNRLTWKGLSSYQTARRVPFGTQSWPLAAYHQTYQNFQFWSILRGGHMVPWDTPEAAIYMLKNIVQRTANQEDSD